MKDRTVKHMKKKHREAAVEAGAYDGRFASRVEPNKKKDLYKTYRRNKHKNYEF